MDIKSELQQIFRDLFDDESMVIFDEMTADDIEDWDSLAHINLINDIEARFRVKFTTKEILSAKNVGEFIRLIEEKIA